MLLSSTQTHSHCRCLSARSSHCRLRSTWRPPSVSLCPKCFRKSSKYVLPRFHTEQINDSITGTWTLPFTAYLLLLQGRVVAKRIQNEKWIGEQCGQAAEGHDVDSLQLVSRCHNNFIENVPLALLLAGVVELNGGNRKVLNGALGALLLLRILHVEFGLKGPKNIAFGRPVGFFGTQGYMAGMAGYAAYLVKGYWGF
jgi:uncharacterized membrane protein YecN with MAPEG domain